MMTTPNALPKGTMLQLGEGMGNKAISLKMARQVTMIQAHKLNDGKHWIDVWAGDKIVIRTNNNIGSSKRARTIQREVTRKIAVFVFENQSVTTY